MNEEQGIGPTLAELTSVLRNTRILIVDGNSRDATVKIAKKFRVEIVTEQGIGKGNAIAKGLTYINDDPRYIIFIDADFTYPAGYINSMIKILNENPKVGMVTGNRFADLLTPNSLKNPFYLGNRLLALAQLMLNGIKMNDPLTGLRVIRWSILRGWKPKSKGFDIEAELNHRIERKGYNIVEVSIPYRERLGKKKLTFTHGFGILKRIMMESMA